MMRIVRRSPDAYLFRDGTHTPVGWLRDRTIRFTRFASHRDGATRVARLVPPADVELVPSVDEVLACGGHPCPRVPDACAYSLEFLLSEGVSLDDCLTIAHALYAAVHHHQMRHDVDVPSRSASWG